MAELKFRPIEEIKAHADRLSVIASDSQYSDDTREQSFNQANMLMDIVNGKWSVEDISELGMNLQHKMDVSEYGYESKGLLQGVDWVFGVCDFKELSTTEEYLRQLTENEKVEMVSFYCGGSPVIASGKPYRYTMTVYVIDEYNRPQPKSVYANDVLECIQKGMELLC